MKTTFLVDGFNLFHSVKDAQNDLGHNVKWLNIDSLLKSYLPHLDKEATFNSIYYFTALRNFLSISDPATIERHKLYMKVLESFGINIQYGRFKEKKVKCKECHKEFTKYEEKETDVAIATKLFELAHNNYSDAYVLVTGDSDLVPAIKTVKNIFPDIKIFSIYPYKRNSEELSRIVNGHFKIKKEKYLTHQLPNPVILKDKREIFKPITW